MSAVAHARMLMIFRAQYPVEKRGWFVDMSAIGTSMGFFYTSALAVETMKCDGDGSAMLKVMVYLGVLFSLVFMVLQFIPIPGLSGVHFGIESYILLAVCVAFGLMFYLMQRKKLTT